MDRCTECGFSYDLGTAPDAAAAITAGTAEFAAVLDDTGLDLRTRRSPGQWSPLEYGCHLRDMLLVQRERVLAARRRDRPSFEPMGRDERAGHDDYAGQDPGEVAAELAVAARMFARVLNRLGPGDWDRAVIYNYPHPADRSLRWVAVHTVHEVEHHLLDIRRQLHPPT